MLMQTAIILAVVTPFGFDLHLGGVLVGVLMLALFSIGVGALSFALALASKDQEWLFWTVQQTLIFPVLLLAGRAAAARGRARLAADRRRPQPADVHRRGRARPVRRRPSRSTRWPTGSSAPPSWPPSAWSSGCGR